MRRKPRAIQDLVDRMFGHDFFVSYARADASEYAKSLVAALDKRQYARFLDIESVQPGSDVEVALRRGLKKSSFMILLITDGALRSKWVPWELETFAKKRPNNVLPVEIGRVFEVTDLEGTQFGFLRDRIRIQDGTAEQQPSVNVVAQIERSFSTWMQNRRRFRLFWITLILGFLAGSATTALLFWLL